MCYRIGSTKQQKVVKYVDSNANFLCPYLLFMVLILWWHHKQNTNQKFSSQKKLHILPEVSKI